jgi:hypothetical protein
MPVATMLWPKNRLVKKTRGQVLLAHLPCHACRSVSLDWTPRRLFPLRSTDKLPTLSRGRWNWIVDPWEI